MKHQFFSLAIAAMALCAVVSCGKKKSPHSAEAQSRAIDMAHEVAKTSLTDTMAMQSVLIKAQSIKSEYQLAGDSLAADDFDATFRENLKKEAPQVAKGVLK